MSKQFHFTLSPPPNWETFEDMLCDLFRAVWHDPNALKNGRSGQPQNGVDVYGQPEKKEPWTGVQAKKKKQLAASSITKKELEAEVKKATQFTPQLSDFIVATTGQRDQKIQEVARLLTEVHQREGLFRVHVYSWEDIEALLNDHRDVCKKWYPHLFSDDKVLEGLERIEYSQEQHYIIQGKSDEEFHSMMAAFSKQMGNLASSMTASGAGSRKVYQVAIDQANILLDQFKPKAALAILEALQKDAWEEADQITKWKILNNKGAAKFQLNEDKEAAQLLIEAAQYKSNDEKVLCNLALAYLLLENLSKSEQYIDAVRQKNAASERAYALRVKIQYLRNENFDRIVEQIPEEFRDLQEIASALGEAAGRYGNLQKCQYWNEIAYKGKNPSPEIAIAYATAMLFSMKENKLVLSTGKVSKSQKIQLENIIAIYGDAYAKIADSDLLSFKLDCLFNRGVAWRLVENFEKAAKDFDLALELDPGSEKYVFHRAELALVSGQKDLAISLLESIKESKLYPATILLAQAYKAKLDNPTAIEVLRKYLVIDPPSELQEHAHYLLVELLTASGSYDEADKESTALLAANQENVVNLLLRAGVLKTIGKEEEAHESLLAAQKLVNKASPFTDLLALAEQYYAFKEYESAIPFYEVIVDPSTNNYITLHLLTCYQQAGKEKEALNICIVLRQNYGMLPGIAEIEAYIYEGTGNLERAKEICTEYLKSYPNDLDMQIRLAVINFRTQNFDELDAFLTQQHPISQASLQNRLHLSQLLGNRGFSDRALEIIYETRRTFFSEGNVHLQYIGIFLTGERENDQLLKVEKVDKNTTVYLKQNNGAQRFYIIEERKDADISRHELDISNRLAKLLMGKKPGDTIVLAEGIQKKEGVIEEIKSKYVHAFHESSAILETDFPDAQGFSVLNLNISHAPGEEEKTDFSVLFEMLDRQHERFIQVLNFYKDGKLTIGALAKLLHKNPIETWGLLRNKPDIGVKSAIGTFQEFAEARCLLTIENPRLVADITSIMTLHGLGIADEVIHTFGRIAIAQSVLDQITLLINGRKGLSEKGFMTVGKEGNDYIREEISAEQVTKNTNYLQGILNWARKACDIIPCEEALKMDAGQRQQLYELFGSDAIDSILLAKQEKRLLLSEDERLRNLAKNSFAIDGIWAQMVLEHMLNKGKLENKSYQKLLIKLVLSNYHHTGITVDTLEEAAKQSSWKPDAQFEKVASILSGERSSDASAVEMAAHFIYKLYTQQLFFTDPAMLLFATLNLLFQSRASNILLLAQLISHIRVRFAWLPALQQEIERLIQQWAQRQPFF